MRSSSKAVLSLLAALLAACGRAPGGAGIDPNDAPKVAQGERLYAKNCASCHGSRLEGQPNWRRPLPSGRMPAPPHDETGHTWHHPDEVLFGITKYGLVPGTYAPPGYQSDMPAFRGTLSDAEINAVLSFIESRWTDPRLLSARAEMLRNRGKRWRRLTLPSWEG